MGFWGIFGIVLAVIAVIFIILYFVGRRLQRRQSEAQVTMENMKQTVSMLIIDKKKMRIKDSGLPAAAIESTPKYLRWTKIPIIKAKVGPKIVLLSAEKDVFELIPTKKECKVDISGLYITEIKSVRGGAVPKPEKKNGFRARLAEKREQKQALRDEKAVEKTKRNSGGISAKASMKNKK